MKILIASFICNLVNFWVGFHLGKYTRKHNNSIKIKNDENNFNS